MAERRPAIRHPLLDEMLRDHQELRDLITKVHRTLAERRETKDHVVDLMREVQDKIQVHFRDEEASGLFEQVTEHAPELGPQAAVLRDQHDAIADLTQRLVAQATEGERRPEWWERLARGFHEFSRQLIHHENVENTMLLDAYESDDGSGD